MAKLDNILSHIDRVLPCKIIVVVVLVMYSTVLSGTNPLLLSSNLWTLSQNKPYHLAETNDDLSKGSIGKKREHYLKTIKDAREIIDKVKTAGNFLSKLSGKEDLVNLPVGIRVGNDDSFSATLIINDINIFQNYTQLFVYLEINSSNLGEAPLIFYSPDIKYSAEGGLIGDAHIGLLADFPTEVFDKKAALVLGRGIFDNTLNQWKGTYAKIGCDGFENINMAGRVIFSTDWMVPVHDTDLLIQPSRVTADFYIKNLTNPSEINTTLSIDKFTMPRMEGFEWKATSLSMDLSEDSSPEYINNSGDKIIYYTLAGEKYHDLVETGDLWKGFHAEEIEVTIPQKLTGGNKVTIEARNMIIDDAGVSAHITFTGDRSLLEFGKSNLSGWAFSIDNFEAIVIESSDWAAQFGGLLYVPIFADKGNKSKKVEAADALKYTATVDPQNGYLFTTQLAEEKNMDLWLASARIHPSSSLSLGYSTKENNIVTKAIINADIGINSSLGEGLEISLPEIGIREMVVQNIGPKIILNTDRWELINNSAVNVGVFKFGFDVGNEDNISGEASESGERPKADLKLATYVQLSESERLTGRGGFDIKGEMITDNGLSKWVNNDFSISEVTVSGKNVIPGIEYLEGSLINYKKHPTYGTGFRGKLSIGIKSVLDNAAAIAQFGTYGEGGESKGYYFIDLAASFQKGIPLGGAILLRGIGGGVYKNMTRPDAVKAFDQIKLTELSPAFIKSAIGESMSGVVYSVQKTGEAFGFKASTLLSTPPLSASTTGMEGELTLFNANLEFGMQFAKTENNDAGSYGTQLIYFQGIGKFLDGIDPGLVAEKLINGKTLEKLTSFTEKDLGFTASANEPDRQEMPVSAAPISAKLLMQIRTGCPEFHGIFGVYLNAGILYGKAVADLLIKRGCDTEGNDPSTQWHIFLGKLSDPVALGIDIPILGDLVRLQAYLMAGNEGLPDELPPPRAYVENFGPDILDNNYGGYPGGPYPNPINANTGKGFATGMTLDIGTPDEGLKFLFMYATLRGGLGFDFLLNQYSQSDCFDDIGINGWYGKGQAWLYANADIGAEVKLGILKFRFSVFNAAAGAMLRVEGPNPFYGIGRLDAKLSLLGLLNPSVKFKIKVGSSINENASAECAEELSPLDIPIIENVYPEVSSSTGEYPSTTSFIVQLNYDIDNVMSDPDDTKKGYQIALPMKDKINYGYTEPKEKSLEGIVVDTEEEVNPGQRNNDEPITIEFSDIFTIQDNSLALIPYTYSRLPNLYGGSRFLVTPESPLPSNTDIIVKPKAYILELEKQSQGGPNEREIYSYAIMGGFKEAPVYVFKTLPQAEDFIIRNEEVAYSYPLRDMKYFHKDEADNIDISNLDFAPAYSIGVRGDKSFLLQSIPDGYKALGRIIDESGNHVGREMAVSSLDYNGIYVFYFEKNSALQKNNSYTLQFFYKNTGGEVNPNFGEEWIVHQVDFNTSGYALFGRKLEQVNQATYKYSDQDGDIYSEGDIMEFTFSSDEGLETLELTETNRAALVTIGHQWQMGSQCNNNTWLASNPAMCQVYEFFDLCADDLIGNNLTHPKEEIYLDPTEGTNIKISSPLPALMFGYIKAAYSEVIDNTNTYCSSEEKQGGIGSGPKLIDCNPGLIDALCSIDFDFPKDPENEVMVVNLDYNIPFGREVTSNRYQLNLNTTRKD